MASVCFVSYYSGSLLFPGRHADVGGAEVQQHYIAQALYSHGVRVCYVIGDQAGSRHLDHQYFSVFRTYARSEGVRFLKFLYPQFGKIWRGLRDADCDYYYVRGIRDESSVTWLYCLLNKRKFVVAIAHDRECRAKTLTLSRWNPKRYLFLFALKRAHYVLAQTSSQQSALREEFGVDAKIVRNVMPLESIPQKNSGKLEQILWVGTIVPHKRPEIFIELAKRFQRLNFTMIGPKRNGLERYRADIKKLASNVNNLTFLDYVNLEEIVNFYSACDLFVHTSTYEGFPNVLLHAWSCGKPVITSFDPDGIVSLHKLGYVVTEQSEFEEILTRLTTTPSGQVLTEMGERARGYIKEFHAPDVIARTLSTTLDLESIGSER